MIQLKELQNFKKKKLKVNNYVLNIKVLCDELETVGCTIIDEEKLMHILGGLDKTFDSVLSTLIEIFFTKKMTIDYAKVLQLRFHFFLIYLYDLEMYSPFVPLSFLGYGVLPIVGTNFLENIYEPTSIFEFKKF